MKRFLALMLALLLVFGTFVACGIEELEKETETKAETDESDTEFGTESEIGSVTESEMGTDSSEIEDGVTGNGTEQTEIGTSTESGTSTETGAVESETISNESESDKDDEIDDEECVHVDNGDDGICDKCNEKFYSSGLEYKINFDNASYIVKGIGTCQDTDLIIPEKYKGVPVTSIGDLAFFG